MPDAKTHHRPGDAGRSSSTPGGIGGVARRAVEGIDASPLALVAGGLVLGAVAGALLPRSERERDLLAPLGGKLSTALAAAIEAGREAGKEELDGLGLNRDTARDKVKELVDGLLKAASTAGGAALEAAQHPGDTKPA